MSKTFEERLESKYIRHLRKEIIKLKRENQQLRKKARRQDHAMTEDSEEDNTPTEVIIPRENKTECPKCGAYGIEKFSSGVFDFYKCDCGATGRLNKAS